MPNYYVHNGYSGWAYGTPSDPQRISPDDAHRLMQSTGLSADQVSSTMPPAQYAEAGSRLFELTAGNRFLFLGDPGDCMDVDPAKISTPLVIDWAGA